MLPPSLQISDEITADMMASKRIVVIISFLGKNYDSPKSAAAAFMW